MSTSVIAKARSGESIGVALAFTIFAAAVVGTYAGLLLSPAGLDYIQPPH